MSTRHTSFPYHHVILIKSPPASTPLNSLRKIGGIGKVSERVLAEAVGASTCGELLERRAIVVGLFNPRQVGCKLWPSVPVQASVDRLTPFPTPMRISLDSPLELVLPRTTSHADEDFLWFTPRARPMRAPLPSAQHSTTREQLSS